AEASVSAEVGQLPTSTPMAYCSSNPSDFFQASGAGYVVPSTSGVSVWNLSSWSHYAADGVGQQLALKVFRKVGDPSVYRVVAHDGPRQLAPGVINTFNPRLEVRAGDILGLNDANASVVHNACVTPAPTESLAFRDGDLADGGQADFPDRV